MQRRDIHALIASFLLLMLDVPIAQIHIMAMVGAALAVQVAWRPDAPWPLARSLFALLGLLWLALSVLATVDAWRAHSILWRFLLPLLSAGSLLALAHGLRLDAAISEGIGVWLWRAAILWAITAIGLALNYELLSRQGLWDGLWPVFSLFGLLAAILYIANLSRASMHLRRAVPMPELPS